MLSVKLNIYTEANNDAMILEYTTDGTAWVKLTGDAGFYNNTSATGSLPQPKWSGLVGSWNTYKTALTAVAGQANVKFRFRFVTNATTTNQGIAIDDFKIYDKPSYDIKVVQWMNPSSGCGLTNNESMIAKVTNLGALDIDSIPMAYSINASVTLVKDTIFSTLHANGTDTITFTFPTKADFSVNGIYNCGIAASLANEGDRTNDTIFSQVTSIPLISTYPYLQDFETATNFWSSGAIAGTDIWQRGTPAKANIVGAASGTNAYATGLANNYSSNANIWLMTPCYDLSTLVNPMLSVKLNIYTEANNDAMILEYTTDGTAWVKLTGDAGFYNNTSATGSLPQPKWSGLVGSWNTYKTALTAVAGQANVKFRFRFVTNATTTNQGIAIDDFKIYDKPSYDIKVVQWMNPSSGCGLTNNESMIAKVTNLGVLDIDSIPMAYSINAGVTIVKDTIFSTLHANGADTITFTFPTKADFSVNGTYDCGIAASLANEGDRTNDTIFRQISSVPLISTYPYLQDFETATNFWSSGAIAGTDIWQRGTPASTNIIGAASGNNAYATNLTGNYNSNSNIWLMTPCFDLSAITNPMLSVKLNMFTEADWDGMILEYTTNGTTWVKLTGDAGFYNNTSASGTVTPPKWSGEIGTWNLYKTSILSLAGQTSVKFRFRFVSDNNTEADGVAIDDFKIYEPAANDVGATEIITLNNTTCGDINDSVSVVVYNYGTAAQDTVPVIVNITTPSGLITLSDTLFSNLLPSTSDTLLVGTFNSTLTGNYSFVAFTKLSSDNVYPENDTAKLQKTVLVPLAIPYTENFNGTTLNWSGTMNWITGHTNTSKVLSENLYDTNPTTYAMSPKVGTITANSYLKFDYSIVNYSTLDTTILSSQDSISVYFATCDSSYLIYVIDSLTHSPSDTLTTKMLNVGYLAGKEGFIYFGLKWGAGDYWVDIDNVVLAEPKTINLGNNVTLCGDQTANFDAGTGFDSYSWFNGATTQTVTIDSVGYGLTTISVYVNAIDPLFKTVVSDTVLLTFDNCSGINENMVVASVYPNPTNNSVNIELPSNNPVIVEVYNLQGEKMIKTTEYNKTLININLSDLANGMYILKVISSQGVYNQRITLQK